MFTFIVPEETAGIIVSILVKLSGRKSHISALIIFTEVFKLVHDRFPVCSAYGDFNIFHMDGITGPGIQPAERYDKRTVHPDEFF